MGLLTLAVQFLVLVCSLAAFSAIRDRRRRGGLPYPPGPRPLPLFGNMFDLPLEFSWLTFTQVSKKHGKNHCLVRVFPTVTEGTAGDVISFHIFGKVFVVLNTVKATKDLFEKRADIYSDRPTIQIHEMYVIFSLALFR